MAICLKIIYISALIFVFFNHIAASNNIKKINLKSERTENMGSGLPSPEDLPVYLNVLDRILDYCDGNKKFLKPDFVFGLFLVNVNLRPFVKEIGLPISTRTYLKILLKKSDNIQRKHNFIWLNEDKPNPIHTLSNNDRVWSKQMSKLNLDLMMEPSSTIQYSRWKTYRRTVDDIENGIPSPRQSDVCLMRLAESEENLSKYPLRCEIPDNCYNALVFGTNVGYSLTHRLILLLFARFSRGCAIFSSYQDKRLRNYFCEMAYTEAEYNALNGFQLVDIFFEQTALCTLDGYAQFLQKSWLTSMLSNQQDELGCFNDDTLENGENSFNKYGCSLHTTAVAAATYAAAVRFILENY